MLPISDQMFGARNQTNGVDQDESVFEGSDVQGSSRIWSDVLFVGPSFDGPDCLHPFSGDLTVSLGSKHSLP